MSPTSTQGCAGALSCCEDAWEMQGEPDTLLLFISEMVMSKYTRRGLCSGGQLRCWCEDGSSVVVPLSLPCHRPIPNRRVPVCCPARESPYLLHRQVGQTPGSPKAKILLTDLPGGSCPDRAALWCSQAQCTPKGTTAALGGTRRGDKSIFGLYLCTCIIQ